MLKYHDDHHSRRSLFLILSFVWSKMAIYQPKLGCKYLQVPTTGIKYLSVFSYLWYRCSTCVVPYDPTVFAKYWKIFPNGRVKRSSGRNEFWARDFLEINFYLKLSIMKQFSRKPSESSPENLKEPKYQLLENFSGKHPESCSGNLSMRVKTYYSKNFERSFKVNFFYQKSRFWRHDDVINSLRWMMVTFKLF